MSAVGELIVAEDDETDLFLLRRAFRDAQLDHPVHHVRDGLQAIDLLTHWQNEPTPRRPALVLLDLKIPRRDGLQTIRWIRAQPRLAGVPVIVFSSSANRHDVERAYEKGANAFLVKPASLEERATIARFLKEWLRLNQVPRYDWIGVRIRNARPP
jgi:CheY-like chemotaxis protein